MSENPETSLLEFPCDFPIKVMGHDREGFYEVARSIVEQHAGAVDDAAIRTAASRNGRFVSMTITIRASSQKQLDDIYMDLSAHKDVLVAL
jgi:putative lipoic acid-binding regulatory protein